MNRKVIVHVSGGVADVAHAEGDVFYHILDFDNYSEEKDMGSTHLDYTCPSCKKSGTEFEWNAATIDQAKEDKDKRIQNENKEEVFTCAFCFSKSSYDEIRSETYGDI